MKGELQTKNDKLMNYTKKMYKKCNEVKNLKSKMDKTKQNEGVFIFPDQAAAKKCENEFGLLTRKGAPVYALSLSEVERLCAENT